jgi:hypothetical protein
MERYAAARIALLEQLLATTTDSIKRIPIADMLSSEREDLIALQTFVGPPDLRLIAPALRALKLGSRQMSQQTYGPRPR